MAVVLQRKTSSFSTDLTHKESKESRDEEHNGKY